MLDIHKVVKHRLFRESCYNHKGNYVKVSIWARCLRYCDADTVHTPGLVATRTRNSYQHHHRQLSGFLHLPSEQCRSRLDLVQRPARHRIDGSLSVLDRPRYRGRCARRSRRPAVGARRNGLDPASGVQHSNTASSLPIRRNVSRREWASCRPRYLLFRSEKLSIGICHGSVLHTEPDLHYSSASATSLDSPRSHHSADPLFAFAILFVSIIIV